MTGGWLPCMRFWGKGTSGSRNDGFPTGGESITAITAD